ncbi:MAG: hypothetical protein ACI9DC_001427 [Gammaproteobacteria bacterium]|jgi:hypothetical protein
MTVFTTAVLPSLTSPPLDFNAMGWINTSNSSGARVDVYGPFSRDGSSSVVSEPAPLAMLGIGLIVAGVARQRRKLSIADQA